MPGQFKITIPLILFSMVFYLCLQLFIDYPVTTILKPIPIILLMLYTVQEHPPKGMKILILYALGCAAMGDMILTLPISFALQAGLLAFMATQFFYICLFIKNMQFQITYAFLFLPFLGFIMSALYYLWPNLDEMKVLVVIYICLFILMVFFSFQVKQRMFLTGLGAVLFLLSDFILSLEVFVLVQVKLSQLFVMPSYYLAQFLIVMGVLPRQNQPV
jgi:uncharacterized membrane protein YhhN